MCHEELGSQARKGCLRAAEDGAGQVGHDDAVPAPVKPRSPRPDPTEIHSLAQLRQALTRYKVWADLSYRDIARTCDHSHSTIRAAATGTGSTPPRLGVLRAYVRACGADDAETAQWDEAWRRINHSGAPGTTPTDNGRPEDPGARLSPARYANRSPDRRRDRGHLPFQDAGPPPAARLRESITRPFPLT
ncbi:helix-turn-helix domain-containing protein [Actinomadura nitritigenes]|uniref:helix-turn-helix domain-containing protein n=1 Tax=Actinomadura nitritigenes TaxID=134602 RepID=UPI003D89D5F9